LFKDKKRSTIALEEEKKIKVSNPELFFFFPSAGGRIGGRNGNL
jgi:hypothetical protein